MKEIENVDSHHVECLDVKISQYKLKLVNYTENRMKTDNNLKMNNDHANSVWELFVVQQV